MKHHTRGARRLTTFAASLASAVATTAMLPSVAHAQFVGLAQSVNASADAASSCPLVGCTPVSLTDARSSALLAPLTLSASVSGVGSYAVRAGFTYTSVFGDGVIGMRQDGGASIESTSSTFQDPYPYAQAAASVSGSIAFDVLSATQVVVAGQDFSQYLSPNVPFTSSLSLSRLGADGSLTEVTSRQNLFGITSLDAGRYVLSMSQAASVRTMTAYPYAGANTFITITAVPEPGTWALMGLGLVGVALASRRRA